MTESPLDRSPLRFRSRRVPRLAGTLALLAAAAALVACGEKPDAAASQTAAKYPDI